MIPKNKFWPCEHIFKDGMDHWNIENDFDPAAFSRLSNRVIFCKFCGSQRPQDALDAIFEKHDCRYGSKKEWQEAIKKDLREWKLK